MWDVKLSKETCSSSGINEQESDIFLAGNLTTFSSLSVYSPRRQEPGPAAGLSLVQRSQARGQCLVRTRSPGPSPAASRPPSLGCQVHRGRPRARSERPLAKAFTHWPLTILLFSSWLDLASPSLPSFPITPETSGHQSLACASLILVSGPREET